MNVEIGTEAPIFLFWEYLFQIFVILSLQCLGSKKVEISRAQPPPTCPSNGFAGIKNITYRDVYKA